MLLPLDAIALPNRQRKSTDLTKVAELAASIEASSLLRPIVVRRPHADEDVGGLPYVLVVGGRRIAAYFLLERTEIEANLIEDLDPLNAEIAELDENIRREALSWQEEINARTRIHALRVKQNPSQTLEETADEIGYSKAQLSKDISLSILTEHDPALRLAPSKGAALRQAEFKAGIATKLANVKTSSSDDIRSRLSIMDGVEFAKTLPSQSVDLVFTDLPYGIDQFEIQSTGDQHEGMSKFDDSAEVVLPFIEKLVPEMIRVVKPNGWICLFMVWENHHWLIEQLDKGGLSAERPPWIWARPGHGNYGLFPNLHAATRYEMIVVANGGAAQLCKKPVENVLVFEALDKDEKLHNHQKPHALCRELIERFTVPGELVADFCFGSGAHLAAAADLGRDFIGSENNPAMLDSAITLIAQFLKPRLNL